MELGTFSISLAVKDLAASKAFYEKLASFTDVRELQRRLKAQGVKLEQEADESTTGPASFIAMDPDGNPILIDQHV
jgi:catechol 2,3-dioxygenase-like lactoylglutathione lyase family enzyme